MKRHCVTPRTTTISSALLLTLCAACGRAATDRNDTTAAMQADSAGARSTAMPGGPDATAVLNDTSAAILLASVDRAEIAAAQLAMRRARSAEVKAFARQMIDEHTANTRKLRQVTSAAGIMLPDSSTVGTRRDSGSARNMSGGATAATSAGGAADATPRATSADGAGVNASIMQLEQQNLRTMDQLRSATGTEFDRMYMDAQVTAHSQVLDILRQGSNRVANADLKAQLTAVQGVVEQHRQHAQQIASTLTGAAPSGTPAQKP